MKTTTLNKTSTTMYEVNDANKEHDYYGSGMKHEINFPAFISSLGFDVTKKYEGSTDMIIDGLDFTINYDKTSYMAKSAYGRKWTIRKDRCIEIVLSRYPDMIAAKIPFNVELDKDKLIKKIENAIEIKKGRIKAIEDAQNNRFNKLEKMRLHYYSSEIIAKYVETIYIEKGVISLFSKAGTFIINAEDGLFTGFFPKSLDKMTTTAEIEKWSGIVKEAEENALKICEEIKRLGAVGEDFSEFAKNGQGNYVKKAGVDRY